MNDVVCRTGTDDFNHSIVRRSGTPRTVLEIGHVPLKVAGVVYKLLSLHSLSFISGLQRIVEA